MKTSELQTKYEREQNESPCDTEGNFTRGYVQWLQDIICEELSKQEVSEELIFNIADRCLRKEKQASDDSQRLSCIADAIKEGIALKKEPQQGWTDEGLEILKRLVELKNIKDEGFNNKQEVNDYNDGKDKAWSDARNYLESLKPKQ